MALSKCPKMSANCPHYDSSCDGDAGDECHYVQNTAASAATALANIQMMRQMGGQLDLPMLQTEERLASLLYSITERMRDRSP